MTKIYEQHDAAFKNVSAFVILKDGERVASIAFKFPKDGAGRLFAYLHWFGVEMVRGYANGYGYDKKSAAVESAVERLINHVDYLNGTIGLPSCFSGRAATDFVGAVRIVGGSTWDRKLQDAGFQVLQAV